MRQIWIRNFDGFGPKKFCQDFVNDKCMLGGNNIVARLQKSVPEEFNDLVEPLPSITLSILSPNFFAMPTRK